ncbi:MAG: hypothetical protein PSV35_01710 [bacterium]|nr:hypothetical protein [bacterium]
MNIISCISLYLNALNEYGWNDYPVRYARMLHSLALFLHAANDNLKDQSMEQIHTRLNEHGMAAINYATKNFANKELYKEYLLFSSGFIDVKEELNKNKSLADLSAKKPI